MIVTVSPSFAARELLYTMLLRVHKGNRPKWKLHNAYYFQEHAMLTWTQCRK